MGGLKLTTFIGIGDNGIGTMPRAGLKLITFVEKGDNCIGKSDNLRL